MGCFASKAEQTSPRGAGGGGPNPSHVHNPAVDGPPDFGLGEQYEVRKLLGEGGTGQTWLCRDMQQRKMVAIKFIKRAIPQIVLPMLSHEIRIQAELGDGHVNLVSAKAVVLTDTHLGIVMEYAAGGNLTAYVTDKWETAAERDGLMLTEDEARYFFRQYINAVEFLHANHVAHRDLKLDNIVLDGSNPPRIKVCDFGFSKGWDCDQNMFTQIGTPVYMCPQLISCKHNSTPYDATKADIWACGVLLFVMLLGMFPYDHTEHPDPNSSSAHMEVWVQQTKYSWRDSPAVADSARKLSLECQDLLDKMFERDEKRRITIDRIKQHRWYKKPVPADLQAALDKIAEEQSHRASSATGGQRATRRMCAERDRELQNILEESGYEDPNPATHGTFKSIDLTRLYEADDREPSISLPAPVYSDVATAGSRAAAQGPGNGPQHAATGQPLQNGMQAAPGISGNGTGSPLLAGGSPMHVNHTGSAAAISSDQVTFAVGGKDEACGQTALNGELPAVQAVAAAQ